MSEELEIKDVNEALNRGRDILALTDGAWQTQKRAKHEVGAKILDEVFEFVGRFVAYPGENEQTAHVLWIVHSHAMDAWDSTPRLAALSSEPGSGKTRLLEVTELLVPRPVSAVNVTPAYLFRKVGDDEGPPPSS